MLPSFFSIVILVAQTAQEPATAPPSEQPSEQDERIISPEEVRRLTTPPLMLPLRIISYPHRMVSAGIEKGLVRYEQHHMRERMRKWTEYLRTRGIEGMFGGMGEQTGFGGGAAYSVRPAENQRLRFLARGTLARYQEFDLEWAHTSSRTRFAFEGSYQWRPNENFYGLGHDTKERQHTDFALRQKWAGLHFETTLNRRLRWGAEYKVVQAEALDGQNPLTPATPDVFPDVPGLDRPVRLQSTGQYFDADLFQGEYRWGARSHLGAAAHYGLGESKLRYFTYEIRAEGRMPVVAGQSAFVGQANVELNRERGGSDPIPFFLQPRVGGSSTLRGFALDRFHGKNVLLFTVEYRYRLHPNLQAAIFYDEGQIFNRTADLTWLNWHRNYGIGFRVHSNESTVMRIEYGVGREGHRIHIAFGDRLPRPVGGAVRYGTYRD